MVQKHNSSNQGNEATRGCWQIQRGEPLRRQHAINEPALPLPSLLSARSTVQIKERAEEPERENLRGWMHNSGCLTRRESRDSNPFPPSRCFEIAGLRTSKITSALNNPLWEWGGRARRGRGAARRVNCFDFTFKRLFANEGLSAAHQGRRPRHEASVGKQAGGRGGEKAWK